MTHTKKGPFGNLDFSHSTFATPVERVAVALRAVLTTSGYSPRDKPMKTMGKLLKALRKEKEYSFNLIPAKQDPPKENWDNDFSEEIATIMGKLTGVTSRRKEVKTMSSGHILAKFKFAGKAEELTLPTGPEPNEAVVTQVTAAMSELPDVSDFAIRKLYVLVKDDIGGFSFHCSYRVANGQET